MRILLTGATGFIGSHVARELVRLGHEVHATVRPESDRRRLRDVEAELRFHEGPLDLVPVEPELALHLAWYATPADYLTSPENEACLAASRLLLGRLRCRAVFAGSCFELDTRLGRLREDAPTRPLTLYSRLKDALRREVEARPDSAWLRFFYQYGPFEHPARQVPSAIRAVLGGRPFKTTPGAQRRDYLHVADLARAVVAVGLSSLTGVVHVGSGRAVPLGDLFTRIGRLAGRPDLIHLGATDYYSGEPMLIEADNARLLSTGWTPRTGLDEGLRETLEWWRRNSSPNS